MKKLKVQQPDGTWAWVFCRRMPDKAVQTCEEKSKALPTRAEYGAEDLEWFQREFPEQTFRLAEVLGT